jgi:arabinan endo-1,5-alpha-L-arabinosidase
MHTYSWLRKTLCLFSIIILIAACGDPDDGQTEGALIDSPAPVFKDVTVHDPSIFQVSDNEFRIIGSFLAAAKTADFKSWTLEQAGGGPNSYPSTLKYYPRDNANPTVQTMEQQKADVLRPTNNDGLNFFASDIHKMPDGKFYHYYSLTSTWKSSAIGVAIADSADGPYVTGGLFVRSAEAGNNQTPDGSDTWRANSDTNPNYPNCIDPQAFFDKDGQHFYLVYGSWSGGIFLYELDTATGFPKAGAGMNAENGGYGRKLIANRHSGIEAPYIIYSPDADYYFLFTSFAGLAANGGYNMRVFRSRNPGGPYEDAEHTDLTGNNLHPTLGNAHDFRNYGVKILGGYQFTQIVGEKAATPTGYLSPGHNSAYYDPAAKKYFLVHHTRFVGKGETHQVRVREMFVNDDGWLVAAPFRYDGGAVRQFSAEQLAGVYKIINHERDNNTQAKTSTWYTFAPGGTIGQGALESGGGTWTLGSDGKTAAITLAGTSYKGVFLRCYDDDHKMWVNAFTALAANGIALWGAGKAAE